jgi:hypothetical protein
MACKPFWACLEYEIYRGIQIETEMENRKQKTENAIGVPSFYFLFSSREKIMKVPIIIVCAE